MTLLALDQSLTNTLYDLTRSNPEWQRLIYAVATYLIFLIPLMLVWLATKPTTRLLAAKMFTGAIITWLVINKLTGQFFYTQFNFRDRPFALTGVKELLFEQPQKSFPSDHAAILLFVTLALKELLFEQPQKSFPSDHAAILLFVTLALFYYRQRVWAWLFLAVTLISSLARVMVGFHWVGDILGGWLVGLIGFGLVVWLDRPLTRIGQKIGRLLGINLDEWVDS